MHPGRMLTTMLLVAGAAGPALAQTDNPASAPVVQPDTETHVCGRPVYPKAAQRNGIQGKVTLYFLIGTDGMVHDSRITQSSGNAELDLAARDALMVCHFKPKKDLYGNPMESWSPVAFVWTLK